MSKYQFTDDMDEISGFGGGYEDMCRTMVIAGLEFWDAQPDTFNPKFKGMKNVYGILSDDNEDAKALTEATVKPTDGDCTGAMHQASIGHILAIRRHGWDNYRQYMMIRKQDEDRAEEFFKANMSSPASMIDDAEGKN